VDVIGRTVLLSVIVAVVLMIPGGGALAGTFWCEEDPILVFNGTGSVHVITGVAADAANVSLVSYEVILHSSVAATAKAALPQNSIPAQVTFTPTGTSVSTVTIRVTVTATGGTYDDVVTVSGAIVGDTVRVVGSTSTTTEITVQLR
jgi:hypothetical protein